MLSEIREILDDRDPGNYKSIYRTRRTMRKLLPDGSETYESLMPAPWAEATEHPGIEHMQYPKAVPSEFHDFSPNSPIDPVSHPVSDAASASLGLVAPLLRPRNPQNE